MLLEEFAKLNQVLEISVRVIYPAVHIDHEDLFFSVLQVHILVAPHDLLERNVEHLLLSGILVRNDDLRVLFLFVEAHYIGECLLLLDEFVLSQHFSDQGLDVRSVQLVARENDS